MGEKLANAPLVEVIFEIKWSLNQKTPGIYLDPNYSLLISRIYDKIGEKNYPYHEKLPTSTMPEEMAAHIIQHRFRVKKDAWPLIQLGPGIITLNETEKYEWTDYEHRLKELVKSFLESYPDNTNFKITELSLRYIDAIDFNYSNNPLKYLEEKIGVVAKAPTELFGNTSTKENPNLFNLLLSFPQQNPTGESFLRISKGQRNGKDAIIFETGVISKDNDVPQELDEICSWIHNSHELTSDWFKKMFRNIMDSFK